jgi:hypothetical protein
MHNTFMDCVYEESPADLLVSYSRGRPAFETFAAPDTDVGGEGDGVEKTSKRTRATTEE